MQNGMTAEEWFEKGFALGGQDKYEEALKAYNKAIELDPQYVLAWNNKGNTLGELGRHEEALEAYNKAIEIDPKDALAWNNRGVTLYKLEKYQEALEAYNKAIEIDPLYAKAWYNKGNILYKLKKYQEALEAYNKAIEIDPKDALAWNNRGVTLYKLESYPEALEAYNKAIELDPQYALAYSNLAEAYFNLGAIEQAITNVNKAINLNEKLTPSLLLRGKIEIEQKDYAGASQTFTQAISSDLGNPIPLLWNAYVQYLKAESTHQPDSVMYQQEVAGIIRQLKKIKEIVGKGNAVARAYILYFMGCFYYKTGDNSEAVRALKQCIELKSELSKKTENSPDEPEVCKLACELLDNIWNYAVRPPLWSWWWFSPLHYRRHRVIFGIISFFIVAPLIVSPFVEITWSVYMFLTVILLIILALPNIQRIRARDIEVELWSPPSMEPVLSPSMFEMGIKGLEASSQQ
ncbi:tetratricopeptide repeat protein [Chloroflexota bacterium]